MTDDIIDEVRRHREAYAASFGYDLRAIYADIKERERASGRPTVQRTPRPAANVELGSRRVEERTS